MHEKCVSACGRQLVIRVLFACVCVCVCVCARARVRASLVSAHVSCHPRGHAKELYHYSY